jgi:hypothetical protein
MSPTGWQERLDHAATADAVVLIANEFLSLWTAEEDESIPADCRLARISEPRQVSTHAFKLAHRLSGTCLTEPAMYRISTFFTKAALRIYTLIESERDQVRPPRVTRESRRPG